MVIELYYKQFEIMRVSRSMSQMRYILAAIGVYVVYCKTPKYYGDIKREVSSCRKEH